MSRYIIECPDGVKVDVAKRKGEVIMGVLVGEVVRCKECLCWLGESEMYEDREYKKCYNFHGFYTAPHDFCSYGERRE